MKGALSVKLSLGQTRLTADIPVFRVQGPVWEHDVPPVHHGPDPPMAP